MLVNFYRYFKSSRFDVVLIKKKKEKKRERKKKVNIKHEVDAIFYVKIILIVGVIINALLTKAIRIDRIQEQITALSNRGQLPRASIHDLFK